MPVCWIDVAVKHMEIEQCLLEYGFYAATVEGVSMYPMLRPRRDTICIGRALKGLSEYDVALYHIPGGKYVLHRVLKVREDTYVICGDNCVRLEYIPREWVIGKLVLFYRGEEKMELKNLRYRLYVALWCRPFHIRILLLHIRHIFKMAWRYLRGNK